MNPAPALGDQRVAGIEIAQPEPGWWVLRVGRRHLPADRGVQVTSSKQEGDLSIEQEEKCEHPMSQFCHNPRCPCHAKRICAECGDPVPPAESATGATRCRRCERARQSRLARRHQQVKAKE
jgi:ribosomal protein L40E